METENNTARPLWSVVLAVAKQNIQVPFLQTQQICNMHPAAKLSANDSEFGPVFRIIFMKTYGKTEWFI